jgi:hypothetical protein
MKLTRMQDVGGCRAILQDEAEVAGVIRRIRRNWKVREIYNYVGHPKETGYRAQHVVVVREGRLIEIQLRTPRQHAWAAAVERAAGRGGFLGLKDGDAPDDVVGFYQVASEILALQEQGGHADEGLMARYENLRVALRERLEQG